MAAVTFTTTLLEKHPRTPGVASFRFARPSEYDFTAGQWFVITIPSPAGPLTKHFTHSSSPTEPFLEFTTRLTGSEFKNALDSLPPGTEVSMEGPFGTFSLREGIDRVAFLTGGIGVTPVRSILRWVADTRGGETGTAPHLTVFYGNVSEETITFAEELDAIAATVPSVALVHVLSQPSESWSGYRGYIRAEILADELEDPAAWTYYISGPPPMVDAMRAMLVELEIPRRQMVLESFEGYTS